MQEGETDLAAKLNRVGKVTDQGLEEEGNLVRQRWRIEGRAFGQRGAFIETVEHIALWIQTQGSKLALLRSPLDNDLDIVKAAAKLFREPVEDTGRLFLKLFVVQLRSPVILARACLRWRTTNTSTVYPVPQNAPHASAGMNVPNFPQGQRPKATDVSRWYGVYKHPLITSDFVW